MGGGTEARSCSMASADRWAHAARSVADMENQAASAICLSVVALRNGTSTLSGDHTVAKAGFDIDMVSATWTTYCIVLY